MKVKLVFLFVFCLLAGCKPDVAAQSLWAKCKVTRNFCEMPFDYILANPERVNGMRVRVSGFVDKRDSHFLLRRGRIDANEGTEWGYFCLQSEQLSRYVGSNADVSGTFIDERDSACFGWGTLRVEEIRGGIYKGDPYVPPVISSEERKLFESLRGSN